ncbi:MAG: tetratricopeptide repeat protein [Planctomycetota bacterium]
MENVKLTRWALLPLIFAYATVVLMVAGAVAQTDSSSGESSLGHSITSGFQNLGRSTTPPPNLSDDPIALKTPAKAGVELYISVARLYVESGKFKEAEDQYQQVLKKAPNDIRVLLGYAMLKDQMNQPQEALKFYQQAAQKHPKQPSVYNNLAIHYARCSMVREAIEAGQRAVALSPREPRYRNNLAALLVEAGMPQEAFKQLREVYDEPVSHYNLGFLLNKRGIKAAALQEFTIALRLSPGMTLARQWVERLSQQTAQVQYPQQYQNPAPPPNANPMQAVASRDPQAIGIRAIPPPAADANNLRRLPAVNDPRYPADPNRDPQGPDLVAPNPPNWQR